MTNTASEIKNIIVKDSEVAVFFMGQAGFIFKDSNSRLIAVDLYLSDCCERFFGFKRLMPKLITPDELDFDIIIATHAHYDHFDIDTMPQMMTNSKTILFTSVEGINECKKLNIDLSRVTEIPLGSVHRQENIVITAVYADHGELAPDAVGVVLKLGGKCIYIAGDTAFRPEKMKEIAQYKIDLMIAPINGAYGNLDEMEAVLLTEIMNPKLVVPCHYGNFAEHGGNPDIFAKNMENMLPEQKYMVMKPGEYIVI